MTSMIDRFFNSSVSQFASFFTSNAKLSQKQLKELRDIIDEQIKE
jgi:predicted transcriptional regulator